MFARVLDALGFWLANLVIGLLFALIALSVLGIIAGNADLMSGPIDIAVCLIGIVGWMLFAKRITK